MATPDFHGFKENEIPITCTTEGAAPGYSSGLTLDPLIKRYLIHIHMFRCSDCFGCECNILDTDPSALHEVYFTEFIPPTLPIPDGSINAVSWSANKNSWTYLTIGFTWGTTDD